MVSVARAVYVKEFSIYTINNSKKATNKTDKWMKISLFSTRFVLE